MANNETLEKQGFSLNDMENVDVVHNSSLKQHNPRISLLEKDNVFEALVEALSDNDPDAFKEILSAHLELINKEEFTKKANISRRTLFRMLSPEGNPTLDNLARVFHALKVA